MGFIEVKEYTSAAEMIASYSAIRRRRDRPVIRPRLEPVQQLVIEKQKVERQWNFEYDAHVNTWARFLLKEVGGRVPAIPIISEMCAYWGVTYHDIRSDRRTRDIAFPRQKMMWVLKQRTAFSYPQIGAKFGDRDHTTVLHAVRKIDALVAKKDPSVEDLMVWIP